MVAPRYPPESLDEFIKGSVNALEDIDSIEDVSVSLNTPDGVYFPCSIVERVGFKVVGTTPTTRLVPCCRVGCMPCLHRYVRIAMRSPGDLWAFVTPDHVLPEALWRNTMGFVTS